MARRWKKTLADEDSDKFIKKDENEQNEFEASKIDYAQLIKALQQYDNEMLEKFFDQPEDEPPISLSDRGRENLRNSLSQLIGENRADLLIQKEQNQYQADMKTWKRSKRARIVKRTVRWGAVAASIWIAIFIGNIFSNDSMAFRLPNVGIISENKGEYSKFKPIEDATSYESSMCEDSARYVLTSTIEGFILMDKIVTSDMNYYVYRNEDDQGYQFSQFLLADNVGINTEEKNYTRIDSPFGDAYYYEFGSSVGLVWNYNGYLFRIEGNISMDQLLYLQESVRKEE